MRDIARLSAHALPGLLLSVIAVPAAAQYVAPTTVETGRGWGVATTTTTTAARVAAIDPKSRRVDLLLTDGRMLGLVAGSDVRRLDQVRVGDVVDVTFVESLVLELRKDGGATVARSEGTDMRRGPSGSAPSAVRQSDVTIIADVVAVDTDLGTITLRGPKATMALRIRDPKQLALVKPGDQVRATYTEAVAVSIDPVR